MSNWAWPTVFIALLGTMVFAQWTSHTKTLAQIETCQKAGGVWQTAGPWYQEKEQCLPYPAGTSK